MIELTSAYKSSSDPKFLLNPAHIIYVGRCENHTHSCYENTHSLVEYVGGAEAQQVYVQESYEQIKEMMNPVPIPAEQMVECVTGKPIYQVWRSTDSCGEFYSWDDCDKYDYDETLGDNRRVLFEHPAPIPEEKIAEIKRKERERCAALLENGRFLHDQAPTKLFATEAAKAIRSLED